MKRYCVVYIICGMHYRFRGYYHNKREARRDCREALGINNRDIVEIYEEETLNGTRILTLHELAGIMKEVDGHNHDLMYEV